MTAGLIAAGWWAIGTAGILWFFSAKIDVETDSLVLALLGGILGLFAWVLVLTDHLPDRRPGQPRVWIRRRNRP